MTSSPQVVAAAIVDDLVTPGALLAARRTYPAQWAGYWEFPGGKVEPGETLEEAVIREVAEELGIQITLGAVLFDDGADWLLHNGMRMRLWLATVSSGAVTLSGSHDDARWLRRDELRSVQWLPGDEAMIAALEAMVWP